ncbi:MAG: nucleotidyltransferase domain-containing protein, partial [Clostridia bacterium]|nr:nucleotidyltransferase domain-containing protein [Clostridia bacterium]
KSEAVLRELYKSASFVVQAIAFRQAGRYFRRQKDLLPVVSDEERFIVETFIGLKHGESVAFTLLSERLFVWAKKWISENN